MAEWSKAPDSSSGPRLRAWVQIPLLTVFYNFSFLFLLILDIIFICFLVVSTFFFFKWNNSNWIKYCCSMFDYLKKIQKDLF